MRFAVLFRTALAAAFLLATASQAAAQNQRPIRRAEAAAVQAADVYEVIERLRPEWLWAGGDPADPAIATRVRVYVGGRHIGSVHALRGMTTVNLQSITIGGTARARALDPRAIDVDAVLLVQYVDPARANAPSKRFQFALGIGERHLMDERAEASLRDEGWLRTHPEYGWPNPPKTPPSISATVSMRVRGIAGVAVNAIRTESGVRGVKPVGSSGRAVTNLFTTLDASATAFAATRYLRLGVGPALRVLDYAQGGGIVSGAGFPPNCACNLKGSTKALGAAADLVLSVPPTGPINAQINVAGRWFAPHEIPPFHDDQPPVEMGGLTLYTTISFGVGF